MLKEIFEQPETVRNAMRGRLDRGRSDGRVLADSICRRHSCRASIDSC